MACPFFVPTEKADDLALPHPARLPLGAAWRGTCAAPGHEQAILNNNELEGCNLGYAKSCPRLPEKRNCDAVRFGVATDSGERISVHFVFETEYRPARHGVLEYEVLLKNWSLPHSEPRIQKLAECFVQGYLERRGGDIKAFKIL